MRLELHCHSRRSDGTDAPEEVARKAAAAGASLFCLTDHDTWSGHEAARAAAPGMTVLRGLELSCAHAGRTVHLLCYGVDEGAGAQALAATLEEVQARRRARVVAICERFLRWNIHLDADAILAATPGTPGRPHVAQALVKAGVCKTIPEAFDRFLRDGGPADVPSPRLSVEEGVALARAAGAKVSLAHPHVVGPPGLVRALFVACKPLGLEGIEAAYGPYPARVRADWTALADELGLVVTAGSDYHGAAVTPEIAGPGVTMEEPRAAALRGWLGIA